MTTAQTTAAAAPTIVHVEQVMGTAVSLHVHAGGRAEALVRDDIARACAVLHEDDATFSLWRDDTPLQRMRRGELSIWDASDAMADVFTRCLVARRLSGGWFDPWEQPGGYDPTGLVKGWSAMRCLHELREAGVEAAMVNAGGDIAVFGTPAGGAQGWRIGVRAPGDAGKLAFVAEVHSAIATSGTYERGDHFVNPKSGRREAAVASATVTGPDLDVVDALATAVACAGVDGLRLIEDIEGHEACVVLDDGSLRATAKFPFPGVERATRRRRHPTVIRQM